MHDILLRKWFFLPSRRPCCLKYSHINYRELEGWDAQRERIWGRGFSSAPIIKVFIAKYKNSRKQPVEVFKLLENVFQRKLQVRPHDGEHN